MSNKNLIFDSSRYLPPNTENWEGRKSIAARHGEYWHEWVKKIDLSTASDIGQGGVGLLGYACEEGVKRNQGRVGAAQGPNAIRERLAKLAVHFSTKVIDFGDVVCQDDKMEATQLTTAACVHQLLSNQYLPILLGGGHDIAFGHFLGIQKSVIEKGIKKLGIINFDAHFDLRPVISQSHSGTPFNQILNRPKDAINVEYAVVGLQPEVNSRELFDIANEHQVLVIEQKNCRENNLADSQNKILDFIERQDAVYVSIDMDGFSSAYAPGVSAPSPVGFSPAFLISTLSFILQSKKVISVDFAELNPTFDIDKSTATLVGRIVNEIVCQVEKHKPITFG